MIRRKKSQPVTPAHTPLVDPARTGQGDEVVGISRRGLLIGTTATGALLVGTYLGRGPIVRRIAAPILGAEARPPDSATTSSPYDAWFEIPVEGKVRLYMPKAEMGQGIHTALAQIAAEDLELRVDQLDVRAVTVVLTSTGLDGRGLGGLLSTAASNSVVTSYGQLRAAANTLKEMLMLEGADQLGLARSEVHAIEGVVQSHDNPSKSLSYGAIVKNRKGELGTWKKPATVPPLKARKDFTVIGTSSARVDSRAKVTGSAVYGFDAKVDGMHYGAVARPPRFGARLTKVKRNGAAKLPGVVSIVVDQTVGFVGVVATTRKRAYDALAKIECTWDGGSSAADSRMIEQMKEHSGGFAIVSRGDANGALAGLNTTDVIERQYFVPAAAHAHLEPLAALANVGKNDVQIWAATQSPGALASDVAAVLKREKPVVVHPTYLGGGFGRKFVSHTAADAVRLSEASGKPVQVALSREEDMAMGPFRPPTFTTFRGAVSNGRVVAIDQHTVSGLGDDEQVKLIQRFGLDIAEPPGLVLPYRRVANYRVKSSSIDLGIPTGIWRGVGLLPNTFAGESFIDELAQAAKVDPLQFRLDHLRDDDVGRKYARLLKELSKRSDWGKPLKDGQGRGVGAAAMAGSIVTTAVQVTVSGTNISVDSVHACVDPGLVINPDGATLQVTGGIVMSLSSAFGEQMTFAEGRATSTNFDSYSLLRAERTPPIDVHLMGSGDDPGGLGEPGVGPVCAAIANAIFAATGQRLRSLPFRLN